MSKYTFSLRAVALATFTAIVMMFMTPAAVLAQDNTLVLDGVEIDQDLVTDRLEIDLRDVDRAVAGGNVVQVENGLITNSTIDQHLKADRVELRASDSSCIVMGGNVVEQGRC